MFIATIKMSDTPFHDDEINLNLAPWLRKKLENNSFKGLEWLDRHLGYFKIAWPEKEKPEFPLLLEICVAWATHKHRNKEDSSQKLKDRFRDTIRKSNYVGEVTHLSVLNLQTGNYRVFKFLSDREAEEKKSRRKASREKNVESTSGITNGIVQNNSEGLCGSQESADVSMTDLSCGNSVFQSELSNYNSTNGSFSCVHADSTSQCLSPISFISTQEQHAVHDNGENTKYKLSDVGHHHWQTACDIVSKLSAKEMAKYKVSLSYWKDTVLDKDIDLSMGYRFHYGSSYWQNEALDAVKHLIGSKQDFDFTSWQFPKYKEKSSPVLKILHSTTAGIILKSENGFQLYGKRLCQSRVYFNDTTQIPSKITKLERDIPTLLFSYQNYIKGLLDYTQNLSTQLPDEEVVLTIGTLPKSTISSTLTKLVLEPSLIGWLKEKLNVTDSLHSVHISSENSVDRIIRAFQDLE